MGNSSVHSKPFALLVALAVVAVASPCLAQGSLQLLPAAASDLVAKDLQVPMIDTAMPKLEQAPVSFSWPLEKTEQLDLVAKPHHAVSRSYAIEVSAAELNAGVTLPTVSKGAYVHLSPMVDVATADLYAIDPLSLELQPANAKSVYNDGTGMNLLVDAKEMQAAGTPFPAGTSAFKVKPALGFGELRLRAPLLESGETMYRIQVLERDSSVTLGLATDHDAYLVGQQMAATAVLEDGGSQLVIDQLSGVLRAPDGSLSKLEPSRSADGTVQIKLPLTATTKGLGLWQLEIEVSGRAGKLPVRRNVSTAFACALPTARLTGLAEVAVATDGLNATLGVDVAAAGRYETRAVLFGTVDGGLAPVAVLSSAAYLAPGQGEITLQADSKLLNGAVAPFELRDLRLLDQGRMGLLHRQERGLVITN